MIKPVIQAHLKYKRAKMKNLGLQLRWVTFLLSSMIRSSVYATLWQSDDPIFFFFFFAYLSQQTYGMLRLTENWITVLGTGKLTTFMNHDKADLWRLEQIQLLHGQRYLRKLILRGHSVSTTYICKVPLFVSGSIT